VERNNQVGLSGIRIVKRPSVLVAVLDKRLRIEEIEIPCSLKASMSMAVVATRGMAPAMTIEAQRKHKNGSVPPL
jgi:hypothetical protein